MLRDTLENWQSEFLLVGGLTLLLCIGSPQSKEGDDRVEARFDEIPAAVDLQNADKLFDEIDQEYSGHDTDPRWSALVKSGSR